MNFVFKEKGNSLDEMLKKASKKLGADPKNIKEAVSNKNINSLLKNLGEKESEKINRILSDKEATSKLLSTPKAKELLKKFLGDK